MRIFLHSNRRRVWKLIQQGWCIRSRVRMEAAEMSKACFFPNHSEVYIMKYIRYVYICSFYDIFSNDVNLIRIFMVTMSQRSCQAHVVKADCGWGLMVKLLCKQIYAFGILGAKRRYAISCVSWKLIISFRCVNFKESIDESFAKKKKVTRGEFLKWGLQML